ncbi:MAG: shikimate kinase [Bacteroidia bacterium]
MSRIFLMGMPGSGKTTLGKKLAAKLGLPFIDLDAFIETQEGKTVSEIFEERGEAEFRNLETGYLKSIISEKSTFFLSLGGGTPCYNNNLALLKENGVTVYLEVPSLMLIDRLNAKGRGSRPLFSGLSNEDLKKKIKDMLEKREVFYKQALLVLNGKSLKIVSAAGEIAALLNKGINSDQTKHA